MDGGRSTSFAIRDRSDVGHARRWVAEQCRVAGFNDSEVGRAELVVHEGLRNMVKYAQRGMFIARMFERRKRAVFEALFLDQGPGMADPFQCLQDGYSTGGSAGEGLGSMRRTAGEFDLYSSPEHGTAIVSRIMGSSPGSAAPADRSEIQWGAVCDPLAGEPASGDSWSLWRSDDSWTLIAVDGLGHGLDAAKASRTACEVEPRSSAESMSDYFGRLHSALRPTRGAAVTLARWRGGDAEWEIGGLGNVSAILIGRSERRAAILHNGIVGHRIRNTIGARYQVGADALLICTSDGIGSKWDLSKYPGLYQRDPSLIAGVIFRDFRRERDDALVVVVRRQLEART